MREPFRIDEAGLAEGIVDTIRQPLLVLDANLHVQTANGSFYQTFEVSPQETENRHIYALGNQQWDIPRLRTLLEEVLPRNRAVTDYEVEHVFPSIGERVMVLNARRIHRGDNQTELILLAIEDITQRKRAEHALKEADRHKDEFLATLAHELRNPLAPIRNAVQLLRMHDLAEPELQAAADLIDRQLQQMTRLVDDLLDISRISKGKLELRKRRVDLAAVIRTAVETSRPMIEARGHQLAVSLPRQTIYLDADLPRLAQAFLNLLNNAAKYTDPGGRIWLSGERQGSDVVVSVRDTGIGVPAEMLLRIFDMFTQVDRAAERSQQGLGIGLTLVRRLIEMHDGSIEARSGGAGLGSEFIVRLPVIIEPQKVRAPQKNPDKIDRTEVAIRRRVLVVDDNCDTAKSLGMLITRAGNEVRTAHDGLEAVELAATFQPDVVLLDIGLPKLNGYEVARRLREERGSDLILIALTGWAEEEDRHRSKSAGFDHHLVKPISFDALGRLLADLQPVPA